MAIHLVLIHRGLKPVRTWECLYFPAVLLFSFGIAVPVGLISGGYEGTGVAG